MATEVVFYPPRVHYCGPSDAGYWLDRTFDPAGTVVECECGRAWVSRGQVYENVFMSVWRPERRGERRRRLRRERRGDV